MIRPCTILVVDDDALISMAAAETLRDLGHRVVAARSAADALEILRGGAAVDLVITDQAMPAMTGMELAAEIRALWPDLPVVLVSGYAELPGEQGLDVPLLGKPYGEKDLAALVAGLVPRGPAPPPGA